MQIQGCDALAKDFAKCIMQRGSGIRPTGKGYNSNGGVIVFSSTYGPSTRSFNPKKQHHFFKSSPSICLLIFFREGVRERERSTDLLPPVHALTRD